MRNVLFYERQNFNEIAYVIILVVGFIGLVWGLPGMNGSEPASLIRISPGFSLFVIAAILANLLTMTTWVYEDEIKVQFGRLFPYYTKRIPRDEIRSVQTVTYKPIREAGGWGIRFGRHDGETSFYLNARGDQGVMLEREGKPIIIGTQFPENFEKAVDSWGERTHR